MSSPRNPGLRSTALLLSVAVAVLNLGSVSVVAADGTETQPSADGSWWDAPMASPWSSLGADLPTATPPQIPVDARARGAAFCDCMGSALHYQALVLVDGAFAGTLAPQPMDSRTDGALDSFALAGADTIRARAFETEPAPGSASSGEEDFSSSAA